MGARLYTVLGIACLVLGLGLLLLSQTGLLWPRTPLSDIGMWTTVLVFVLFGAFGLVLARLLGPSETV